MHSWRLTADTRFQIAALLAPVLLALVLFHPALGSLDLTGGDTRVFVTARDRMVSASLAAGHGIPRWAPEIYGGLSALGSPELGLCYPPGIALAWLAPERAVTIGIVLHLVLAAFTARALALALGARPAAAVLSGLAYAFGGALVSIHMTPPQVASNAWLPLVAWGVARAAQGEWARGLLGATVAQLAIVLCGDPQLGVAAALAGAVAGSATDVKNVGRAVAAAVASGAGALFLGAVQVAPALAAFPELERRDGLTTEIALFWSLHPPELVGLLVPFAFGARSQPPSVWWYALSPDHDRAWVETYYVGPIVLALAAVGLGRLRRSAAARAGAGLVAAFLPFALGRHSPLYTFLLEHSPTSRFFHMFRFPAKLALPAMLGLTLLAAAGASALTELPARRRFGSIVGLLGVVAAVGGCVSVAFARPLAAWIDALAFAVRDVPQGHASEIVGATAVAALTPRCVLVAGVAAAGAALALGRRRRLGAGLIALVVVDLGLTLRPVIFFAQREPFERAPRVAPILEGLTASDGAPARVLAPHEAQQVSASDGVFGDGSTASHLANDLATFEGLAPNSGLGRGVYSQAGFVANSPLRIKTLGDVANDHDLTFRRRAILLGARYSVIVDGLQFDGPCAIVGRAGSRSVVRFEEAPPWAELVGRVRLAKEVREAAALVVAPAFDPRREVVLETGDALSCLSEVSERGRARLESPMGREAFDVAVDAPGPGWLVVREAYASGWRAWVDGAPAEIVPADVAFRGVHVPAGARRVRFEYETPGLLVGAVVSSVSLGVLLALLALRRARGPDRLAAVRRLPET